MGLLLPGRVGKERPEASSAPSPNRIGLDALMYRLGSSTTRLGGHVCLDGLMDHLRVAVQASWRAHDSTALGLACSAAAEALSEL